MVIFKDKKQGQCTLVTFEDQEQECVIWSFLKITGGRNLVIFKDKKQGERNLVFCKDKSKRNLPIFQYAPINNESKEKVSLGSFLGYGY